LDEKLSALPYSKKCLLQKKLHFRNREKLFLTVHSPRKCGISF
jgi:hypothetical protein